MVFFGLYSAFLHLQTQRVESMPKSSVLVSSDYSAFSQAFSESFRFSRQTVNRPVHVTSCGGKTCRFRSKSITVWCVSTRILGDCGLNCLQITNKLLPCNFGIQRLSHDQPHCTSEDLAWSSRPRAINGPFIVPLFQNNLPKSCHLPIKVNFKESNHYLTDCLHLNYASHCVVFHCVLHG